MTLTKQGLIDKICEQADMSQGQSRKLTEAVLKIIKDTLVGGEDMMISGLGRFSVKQKRPRRGRNPSTGDDYHLRARRVITFRASGLLRDKMNGN